VQEVLRVARLTEPERVRQQLQLYNRLLPGKSRLQAAFLIETLNPSRATDDFKAWESLAGENVFLCLGSERLPSRLITCRPEDRALGGAHWVEFPISTECRGRLDDPAVSAHFAVELDGYRHESAPLAEEVRHSLAEDLQLSDQD
jgi:hypothetical protein